MSDTGDSQDMAESLDSEMIGDAASQLDDDTSYPPDTPLGIDEYGLSAAEAEIPEPFAESAARENADPLLVELGDHPDRPSGEISDPDSDAGVVDGVEVGRLQETEAVDDGTDEEDVEADSVASAFEGGGLSAEESAVHTTDDPPFHQGDTYLE